MEDTAQKRQFCAYLRETLIPDLQMSGMDATAEDFEMCLRIMDDLENNKSIFVSVQDKETGEWVIRDAEAKLVQMRDKGPAVRWTVAWSPMACSDFPVARFNVLSSANPQEMS